MNEELLNRMREASTGDASEIPATGDASEIPATGISPELRERMEEASEPPPATGTEKVIEVWKGTASGLVSTAALPASAYAGVSIGMGLGTPGGPPGILVGGILGFLLGAGAGTMAEDAALKLLPASDKKDLTPYRKGGETFGQTLGVAPWILKMPVAQAQRLAYFLKNITPELGSVPGGIAAGKTGEVLFKIMAGAGETAKKYPKSFLTSEAIAGAGAAVAGGAAEVHLPGDSVARAGAEALGGLLAPGRNFFLLGGNALDLLKNLPKAASKTARQQRAADKMQTILSEAGEDPSQFYRRLTEQDLTDVPLTSAQKTGSMALSALQTTLARNNVQYGAQMRKQAEDAFRAHELLLDKLHLTVGTPETLTFVARRREEHFTRMLEERIALAETEAAMRSSKITVDTPQSRANIGKIHINKARDGLADGRSHETMLWNNAYKDAVELTTDAAGNKIVRVKQVKPLATGQEFMDIVSSMTQARFDSRVPKEIKALMRSMGINKDAIALYKRGQLTPEYIETGKVPSQYLMRDGEPILQGVDAQELIKARGDLLSFARDAAGKSQLDNARFYGRLAESVLDDLGQLNSPAYDAARQFSNTLNRVYSRTYAGEITRGKKKTGAEKIPAELLVSRAYSTNADLTTMRMREIQDAVGMMSTQYDNAVARFGADSVEARQLQPFAESANQRVDSILDAQQRVYRLAAAKSIDAETGRVNTGSLQRFVNENKEMLDQLGITDDLTNAVRAENAFKTVKSQNSFLKKKMRQDGAFAKVLNRENPVLAIGDVLTGDFPYRDLSRLVQLAKSKSPEGLGPSVKDAVNGLKSGIMDHVFTKAGGVGNLDVAAYKKALFEPIGPGKPSIVNMLRRQGLMDREEVRNILRIIRPMEKIMAVSNNQQMLNELLDNADAITDFGLRVLGSSVGRFASFQGSSSLIAAQAGSSAVRNIFDKQPNMLIRGIMEEATTDPKLMEMMLKRGKSRDQSFRVARGLHAYLVSAGLNFSEFEEQPPEDQPREAFYPKASEMLFNMLGKQPPAPVTRGTPNLRLPTPQGPAQEAQARQAQAQPQAPGAPTGSSSREMLERLFPFDMS